MSTRRWTTYNDIGYQAFYGGRPVTHNKDASLVNCIVANYAEARRNVVALPINIGVTATGAELTGENQGWSEYISIPIGGLLRTLGGSMLPVVVNLYCSTVSEDVDNTVIIEASIGNNKGTTTVASPTFAWKTINITMSEIVPESARLVVRYKTLGANVVYVYGISVYQSSATPSAWVDLNTSYFGADEYPCSSAVYNHIRNQNDYIRRALIPSSNIMHHWFGVWATISSSYVTLGRYKIVKRRGVSTQKIGVLYSNPSGATGQVRIRTTINSVSQETTLSGVSAPTWAWLTDQTYSGDDITDEIETEFVLEGKDHSGTSGGVSIHDVVIIDDADSSVSHTVPDPEDAKPRSTIKANTIENIRTTNAHLEAVGARQICMQDYRWTEITTGSGAMVCSDTSFNKMDVSAGSSVICRVLAYPSYGSKRFVVNFGYSISAGDSYRKLFVAYVTDNLTDIDTYDSCGPGIEYDTGTGDPDGAVLLRNTNSDEQNAFLSFTLDIPSEHWDDHGDYPLYVILMFATEDSSETISPKYVTIHEAPLDADEFP